MNKPQTTILKETANLLLAARGYVAEAIPRLFEINEKQLWKGSCSSWNEYLVRDCQIDPGQASRWMTAYRTYVIEGGLDSSQFAQVNPDKLYKVRNLPGSIESRFSKALTLTPKELKHEKLDAEPHEPEPVTFCKVCRLTLVDGKHPE